VGDFHSQGAGEGAVPWLHGTLSKVLTLASHTLNVFSIQSVVLGRVWRRINVLLCLSLLSACFFARASKSRVSMKNDLIVGSEDFIYISDDTIFGPRIRSSVGLSKHHLQITKDSPIFWACMNQCVASRSSYAADRATGSLLIYRDITDCQYTG
jgi:hypothetical protein